MLVSLTQPALPPFNLDAGTLAIGRDPSADIVIDSSGVSRLHAMIRVAGDEVELVDARSSNGTYLNGVKIERAVLRYGDVVRVGTQELKVVPRAAPPDPMLSPPITAPGEAGTGPDTGALPVGPRVLPEALSALAAERRQLALLYSVALRMLEAQGQDPVDALFALLDRLASFDAAFVIAAPRTVPRHHPAGLVLREEDLRKLLAQGGELSSGPRFLDGPDDAVQLSTYRARSRAVIPLANGGVLVLAAGVAGAYGRDAEFLTQIGRILSAALASRSPA
jgi:hypothetical protein